MKVPIILILLASLLWYCTTTKPTVSQAEVSNEKETVSDYSRSPVVSAQDALSRLTVEDGFEVQLVAAEPLVSAPVAISFDAKGRIWVVEMPSYMTDTLGSEEDAPTGKIVILEDTNQDGVADTRRVFIDSLVLPRAICFVEGGLLVAEPPSLWYYEIVNDRPGKRTLVDSAYAKGGNVEHQPNGLLRAMDNWIYNAKSDKRYRKEGNSWKIEKTHFRGQWGISQDNSGRLYYNNNSQNIIGDYFLPGFGAANGHQRNIVDGFNMNVVPDNRVYPARPTPGVNRGYMTSVLDDSLRLLSFTAACGPLVYRGDLFGESYQTSAFVAEPSANLIKRNILSENGYRTHGVQAYQHREFITSTDERFRPVNLTNAPDGAVYLVDLYRGIIQHKTYLTTYLKGEIAKRQLTQPLDCGRIYRIVPKKSARRSLRSSTEPAQLTAMLGSPNGWIRDFAQQTIIDQRLTQLIPTLKQLVATGTNDWQRIHAFWTLEGLHSLPQESVLAFLQNPSWRLRLQGLGVLPSVLTASTAPTYTRQLETMIGDTLASPYLGFLAKSVTQFQPEAGAAFTKKLIQKYGNDRFVAAAVVSNLYNQEEAFQEQVRAYLPDTTLAIHKELAMTLKNAASNRTLRDPAQLAKQYPKGSNLFTTICQTCHGKDGNGVQSLAPPLNKSEWVTGQKDHLISIVLFGLTGPVKVNNHLYTAPEINADMPGIGYDASITNEEIAELLSFIRKSWQNNANTVQAKEVEQVRKTLSKREKAFTIKELTGG